MSVAVVGAGYVGLTTGRPGVAHLGHEVGADIDASVRTPRKGEVPILEDGLPALVAEGLARNDWRSSSELARRRVGREIVFLCVQTPQGADVPPTWSYVEQVAREIGPALSPRAIVVNKSTVPVGSTRFVQRVLAESGTPRERITVVPNPEFLREVVAVRDFFHPYARRDRLRRCGVGRPRFRPVQGVLLAPTLVTDPGRRPR